MVKVKLNELEYNVIKGIIENHPILGPLKRTPEYYCDIEKTPGGFDEITHQNIFDVIDQIMIDVGKVYKEK